MNAKHYPAGIVGLLALGFAAAFPGLALAHCDGLDGPVVAAARDALKTGNIDPVLVWVRPNDEPEIRQAFERTQAVRVLGDEARELADTWFFETLVRVHRAGEGAPYTGLKPSGRNLGPAIPLADQAIASGELDPLVELITRAVREGLTERFEHARSLRDYSVSDVPAGRDYVGAYVSFIHYVERAWEAASRPAAGHFAEHEAAPGEEHDR